MIDVIHASECEASRHRDERDQLDTTQGDGSSASVRVPHARIQGER